MEIKKTPVESQQSGKMMHTQILDVDNALVAQSSAVNGLIVIGHHSSVTAFGDA